MKIAVIKGAQIGAIAGFLSAIIYAVFFLIMAELLLPIPDPSAITIFTYKELQFIVPILLSSSIFWLFLPTLIGVVTGSCFGFVNKKFNQSFKVYVFTCTMICAVSSLVVSTLALISLLTSSYTNNFFLDVLWNEHLQMGFLFTAGLFFIPSMIYVFIGFIVSRSLHQTLTKLANVQTSSY
jgi:hypothetical protein